MEAKQESKTPPTTTKLKGVCHFGPIRPPHLFNNFLGIMVVLVVVVDHCQKASRILLKSRRSIKTF
jgi:hypothetical protein